jgi:uracil-DNA glycosylase
MILPKLKDPKWQKILDKEFQEPYFQELMKTVQSEREAGFNIFPPQELVFNALDQTPFDQVKVVIVGQDPYHGPGQAMGLSFSVPDGVKLPPSLKNIFKELENDLGVSKPTSGNLTPWASQGVLLLNTTLTVREGAPLSHHGMGWERFTDFIIKSLCMKQEPIIFVLWGKKAEEKIKHVKDFVNTTQHVYLTAAHPSPFAAHSGFFGCKHFSKINQILIEKNTTPINWFISYTERDSKLGV